MARKKDTTWWVDENGVRHTHTTSYDVPETVQVEPPKADRRNERGCGYLIFSVFTSIAVSIGRLLFLVFASIAVSVGRLLFLILLALAIILAVFLPLVFNDVQRSDDAPSPPPAVLPVLPAEMPSVSAVDNPLPAEQKTPEEEPAEPRPATPAEEKSEIKPVDNPPEGKPVEKKKSGINFLD